MGAVPADFDTGAGPPTAVPLRNFLVGFGFLLAGAALGLLVAAGAVGGFARFAYVHLLLVGWVCLTILGAMTQFVPVRSGIRLHSRRLADLQLVLVAAGLVGFVAALLASATAWLPVFGTAMLAGFWTFVYTLGRDALAGATSGRHRATLRVHARFAARPGRARRRRVRPLRDALRVVPFLIWVERYSDRVGLEPVPTTEELYDRGVAAVRAVRRP